MKKIVLSALFAVGFGLAASTGANAAPAVNSTVPGVSLVTPAEVIIVEPHHHRRCHYVTVCRHTPYGRRCHQERVCRY